MYVHFTASGVNEISKTHVNTLAAGFKSGGFGFGSCSQPGSIVDRPVAELLASLSPTSALHQLMKAQGGGADGGRSGGGGAGGGGGGGEGECHNGDVGGIGGDCSGADGGGVGEGAHCRSTVQGCGCSFAESKAANPIADSTMEELYSIIAKLQETGESSSCERKCRSVKFDKIVNVNRF